MNDGIVRLNSADHPKKTFAPKLTVLGEHAPEGITEADLDEMRPEPDPIRVVLRSALTQLLALGEQINRVEAQCFDLRETRAALQELIADALQLHQQGL